MKDDRRTEETRRDTGGSAGEAGKDRDSRPPKQAERPAPDVKHVPEPDAENIMPAEHEPGTL